MGLLIFLKTLRHIRLLPRRMHVHVVSLYPLSSYVDFLHQNFKTRKLTRKLLLSTNNMLSMKNIFLFGASILGLVSAGASPHFSSSGGYSSSGGGYSSSSAGGSVFVLTLYFYMILVCTSSTFSPQVPTAITVPVL